MTKYFVYFIALVSVAFVGCTISPQYHGDGRFKNTSHWGAWWMGDPRNYTIRLASFAMNTNVTQDFNLGRLGVFGEPRVTICIRLKEEHSWWHLSRYNAEEREFAAKRKWRNIDDVKSSFGYQLSNESGVLFSQTNTPLKNYTWSRALFDSDIGREIEIYGHHVATGVPRRSRLKLHVDYTGDPALTNQADFVVVWEWSGGHPQGNVTRQP